MELIDKLLTILSSFDGKMLALAVCLVAGILILQILSFRSTGTRIKKYLTFFSNVHSLGLVRTKVSKSDLNSKAALDRLISSPKEYNEEDELEEDSTLVNLIQPKSLNNEAFKEVIKQTNAYLCKNSGTSADLGILEDICERKLNVLETEISSTLNVPLYLGLGGTFLGIVTGVLGLSNNITSLLSAKPDSTAITFLLFGVGIAMFASLVGLTLMVYNSAFQYKKAILKVDEGKSEYYDFLRRELMPTMSNSMASSLNSLRGVLGHFVDRFGQDLDSYADSAALLNENLEKQHMVLLEINKLGVTETSKAINKTFLQLKKSSDALQVFLDYQNGLNATIEKVDGSVENIAAIIHNFEKFTSALDVVIKNQNAATELQQQFRESIEQNFPTGSDARDIWREQFDELIKDSKLVTNSLNEQLAASTEYIRSFVNGNKSVFEAMGQQQAVIDKLVEYSQMQAKCYEGLRSEMTALKQSFTQCQNQTVELNKDLIKAVKEMTATVKELKSK